MQAEDAMEPGTPGSCTSGGVPEPSELTSVAPDESPEHSELIANTEVSPEGVDGITRCCQGFPGVKISMCV